MALISSKWNTDQHIWWIFAWWFWWQHLTKSCVIQFMMFLWWKSLSTVLLTAESVNKTLNKLDLTSIRILCQYAAWTSVRRFLDTTENRFSSFPCKLPYTTRYKSLEFFRVKKKSRCDYFLTREIIFNVESQVFDMTEYVLGTISCNSQHVTLLEKD